MGLIVTVIYETVFMSVTDWSAICTETTLHRFVYFTHSMYPSRLSSRTPSRAASRAVSRRNSANSHVSSSTWRSALRSARIQHSGLRRLRAAALGQYNICSLQQCPGFNLASFMAGSNKRSFGRALEAESRDRVLCPVGVSMLFQHQ